VKTIIGRPLTVGDSRATSDIPIVVSYQFWTDKLNQDRDLIGRVVRIKDFPFRLVGVLPSGFHGLDIDRSPDVRLPISAARILGGNGALDVHSLPFQILVRLRPGKAPAAAAAAITRVMQEADAESMRAYFAEQTANLGRQGRTLSPEQIKQTIRMRTSYRVHLLEVSKASHACAISSRQRSMF
jgi:hypothetical protein